MDDVAVTNFASFRVVLIIERFAQELLKSVHENLGRLRPAELKTPGAVGNYKVRNTVDSSGVRAHFILRLERKVGG